jgi:hypothetical protein
MIEQTEKWLSHVGRGHAGSVGLGRARVGSVEGARIPSARSGVHGGRLAHLARSIRGLAGPGDE